MEKPHILHLFTPAAQASPFDVNMAYDAGYQAVVPYTGMRVADVTTLTQDAIFSRGPKGVKRTGIFIGGRDLGLALEMLDAAKRLWCRPRCRCFVDPSGAFTTAAAVAAVERCLKRSFDTALAGKTVLVLGGTGPVGTASAVLAAQEGARVRLASSSGLDRAQAASRMVRERYSLEVEPALADAGALDALLADAQVVIAAAKAGVEVVAAAALAKARELLVGADVNAVPPAGIAGVGVMDDDAPPRFASGSSALMPSPNRIPHPVAAP
jgi:methylene-tetrahydromethanopterin dehydrogenase